MQQLNVPSSSITFDQPLFTKALEISKAAEMNTVIRSGGFHLLMLFLGGIGTIMEDCRLAEETIHVPNIVVHMLESKTYARTLRCHLLIETSPTQISLNEVIVDEKKIRNSLVEINLLYSYMFENTVEHFDGDSLQSEHLQHVIFAIEEYKNSLCKSSRTSKLWIQNRYHISLGKDVIYAERTADWKRHLVTVKCMLNLLAAAGRLNYAKSAKFTFRA